MQPAQLVYLATTATDLEPHMQLPMHFRKWLTRPRRPARLACLELRDRSSYLVKRLSVLPIPLRGGKKPWLGSLGGLGFFPPRGETLTEDRCNWLGLPLKWGSSGAQPAACLHLPCAKQGTGLLRLFILKNMVPNGIISI